MDKNLIEQYKNEMLRMYGSRSVTVQVPETSRVEALTPSPAAEEIPMPPSEPMENSSTGSLTAIVTTLRSLYPVPKAKVTVFTGNIDDMTIIDSDITDQSGRTKRFILKTPVKELSQTSGASEKPYASYNMLVEADGYIDNIHLNIPVFSGTNSLQSSNLMLKETAGENKGPQIFDEAQQFTL